MIALYIMAIWFAVSTALAFILGPILNENGKRYPRVDDDA